MTSLRAAIPLAAVFFALIFSAGPVRSQGEDFLKVTGPCNFSFPADHGPHPGYRTEWWYYTGHLTDADHRRFGFQLTFFRFGLKPPGGHAGRPSSPSAWRTNQVYMAHAALTDTAGGRHLQAEKTARPVLSMAGAEPFEDGWRIFLNTWQAVITPDHHRLQAETEAFALNLDLIPDKPPVSHGEAGYSRKGLAPEQASCYYSFTRLEAKGRLTIDSTSHPVEGTAWMDHEFSTAPLQPGITGWDWFSLQLSDRTEVMVFMLRQKEGGIHPASSGTYVTAAGASRHLNQGDVRIAPLAFWTSPHTGARYPVRWELTSDALHCHLVITADLKDQEMRATESTSVIYWEGGVQARGRKDGTPVKADGYVELTGYAKAFDAPM